MEGFELIRITAVEKATGITERVYATVICLLSKSYARKTVPNDARSTEVEVARGVPWFLQYIHHQGPSFTMAVQRQTRQI